MVLILLVSLLPIPTEATNIRDIEFPVSGQVTHRNDYGEPRSGGRSHEGNDLMGEKMMPLLAAVDGWVSYITIPEASWGYGFSVICKERWPYFGGGLVPPGTATHAGSGGITHWIDFEHEIVGVLYEVVTAMSEMMEPITAVGHRFQDVITAAVVD